MVLCPCCGVATAGPDDGMCESCAMEDAMATERMDALANDGHHPHCASRMVYGDIDVADMAFAGQRGGRVLMCVFVFFSKGGVYAISMR